MLFRYLKNLNFSNYCCQKSQHIYCFLARVTLLSGAKTGETTVDIVAITGSGGLKKMTK
jgi:hypothetical protein